jgi:4-amino-4-deoxy-L-arabinose transferase-like glycosyltransferase
MKSIHLCILATIVLIGMILRFWQFGSIPQGFQVDEAAFGYNAYSLLKTGKDEYGTPHPITLRSFEDQKAALYAYVDIPFIAIMGLNQISVRMPSAVLGILFIILAYAISLKLTNNKKMSLIIAALFAISPTLIFLSRVQSDPMLGAFLVALGFYLFLWWIKSKHWLLLFGTLIAWGLSLIAYQSPRVFLLVFLPFLFWHYRLEIRRKLIFVFGGFYILMFLCIVYLTVSGGARFNQTSIFTTPEVKLVLEEAIREEAHTPPIITRVFENKLIYYGRAFVNIYFSYINFDFLFLQTREPVRESIQNTGFLYFIELPFILIGIYQVIKKKLRWGYFVLGWIFLTPLVLSPFMTESPNIHRFLLAILPLEILVGFGISYYFDVIKSRIFLFRISLVVIPLIFIFSLAYFLNELFVHQPVHRPWLRNYAFQELIPLLKKYEPKYKKIIVTNSLGNSYIYYLFYNQYDPKKYQESGSRGNENPSTIGKYEFVSVDCPLSTGFNATGPTKTEQGVLYVDDGMVCVNPKKHAKLIKVINWGDNNPAFKLFEYSP